MAVASFEIDQLLSYRKQEPFLISNLEFNETKSTGSINHLCCGFKNVSGLAGRQEMDIVLERHCGVPEAISRCFTGLIGD
jgi:hypothetical protein